MLIATRIHPAYVLVVVLRCLSRCWGSSSRALLLGRHLSDARGEAGEPAPRRACCEDEEDDVTSRISCSQAPATRKPCASKSSAPATSCSPASPPTPTAPTSMERLLARASRWRAPTVVGDVREEILDGAAHALRPRGRGAGVRRAGPHRGRPHRRGARRRRRGVPLVEARTGRWPRSRSASQRGPHRHREQHCKQVHGARRVPRWCSTPSGSAPMFILRLGQAVLFFVPGVPREYRALVDTEVLPRIDALRAERGRPASARSAC